MIISAQWNEAAIMQQGGEMLPVGKGHHPVAPAMHEQYRTFHLLYRFSDIQMRIKIEKLQ